MNTRMVEVRANLLKQNENVGNLVWSSSWA